MAGEKKRYDPLLPLGQGAPGGGRIILGTLPCAESFPSLCVLPLPYFETEATIILRSTYFVPFGPITRSTGPSHQPLDGRRFNCEPCNR